MDKSAKKPYEPPVIEVIGTMEALTGSGGFDVSDKGSGYIPNRNPVINPIDPPQSK
jgi:hypothetical protein